MKAIRNIEFGVDNSAAYTAKKMDINGNVLLPIATQYRLISVMNFVHVRSANNQPLPLYVPSDYWTKYDVGLSQTDTYENVKGCDVIMSLRNENGSNQFIEGDVELNIVTGGKDHLMNRLFLCPNTFYCPPIPIHLLCVDNKLGFDIDVRWRYFGASYEMDSSDISAFVMFIIQLECEII